MFTCIECEHHFDSMTGDLDERMCYDCMDGEEDETINKIKENNENT